MTLQSALLRLTKGGPEQQAIDAGEIDAIVDYSSSNVILFPAARRALHAGAVQTAAAHRVRSPTACWPPCPARSIDSCLPVSSRLR